MRYLRSVQPRLFRGKTVLVRIDLNTADAWRLEHALPTLKFLLRHGARVVAVSHRGRPTGKSKALSLRTFAPILAKAVGKKVHFIPHFRFVDIKHVVAASPAPSVFLLENIRFLPGEMRNDNALARSLASLGDFYVNEAFSVSHRAQASVSGVPHYLPHYVGFGLQKEVENLSRVLVRPKQPLVIVMSGVKAESKWKVVEHFKNTADTILLGGAPAHTVLKVQGMDIGRSIWDPKGVRDAKQVATYPNVALPLDFMNMQGAYVDVGIETVRAFENIIEKAGTIIWNGPFGLTEKARFAKGTLGIAHAIVKNRRAFIVAGGGETVSFLRRYKLEKKFDFVSTGGGAMLEFLAGKKLPGIEVLRKK